MREADAGWRADGDGPVGRVTTAGRHRPECEVRGRDQPSERRCRAGPAGRHRRRRPMSPTDERPPDAGAAQGDELGSAVHEPADAVRESTDTVTDRYGSSGGGTRGGGGPTSRSATTERAGHALQVDVTSVHGQHGDDPALRRAVLRGRHAIGSFRRGPGSGPRACRHLLDADQVLTRSTPPRWEGCRPASRGCALELVTCSDGRSPIRRGQTSPRPPARETGHASAGSGPDGGRRPGGVDSRRPVSAARPPVYRECLSLGRFRRIRPGYLLIQALALGT